MSITNNICGKGLEDLSERIENVLKGKEEQPFIIIQHESLKDNKYRLSFYHGFLPSEIQLSGPEDEGDGIILSVKHDTYNFKAGNREWQKVKGPLQIPVGTKVTDTYNEIDKDGINNSFVVNHYFYLLKKDAFNFYFGNAVFPITESIIKYDKCE